jgi:hypothetical protein
VLRIDCAILILLFAGHQWLLFFVCTKSKGLDAEKGEIRVWFVAWCLEEGVFGGLVVHLVYGNEKGVGVHFQASTMMICGMKTYERYESHDQHFSCLTFLILETAARTY